jgi:hypothetical protein
MNSSLLAARGAKPSRGLLKIREAAFEDYHQIAELHVRNGHDPRSYEDWRAIWTGNPVYEQTGGRWPIGWVLETADSRIVGSIANIPLAYQFRGRKLRAAASRSWIVDGEYRSCSMLLMSYLIRQKDIDLFICTTVNPASEPSYRNAFRFSRVPVGTWDKSEFWITNYRGFSQSALTMKSFPLPKALSSPVSAALFCWDKVRDAGLRTSGATSEIELCSRFDNRFDDFWEELKHQKQHLLAVRTRETLEWHFRYSLVRQNVWILAISKGSQLTAYAIFDRLDHPTLGLKRVRLVDFQALNGHEKELGSALRWALRKCREERVHVLENTGCSIDLQRLPQIPTPYQRSMGCWMYYYRADNKSLSETLLSPKVWAPSSFDGDASL